MRNSLLNGAKMLSKKTENPIDWSAFENLPEMMANGNAIECVEEIYKAQQEGHIRKGKFNLAAYDAKVKHTQVLRASQKVKKELHINDDITTEDGLSGYGDISATEIFHQSKNDYEDALDYCTGDLGVCSVVEAEVFADLEERDTLETFKEMRNQLIMEEGTDIFITIQNALSGKPAAVKELQGLTKGVKDFGDLLKSVLRPGMMGRIAETLS
jgi:hypothetical protein